MGIKDNVMGMIRSLGKATNTVTPTNLTRLTDHAGPKHSNLPFPFPDYNFQVVVFSWASERELRALHAPYGAKQYKTAFEPGHVFNARVHTLFGSFSRGYPTPGA